VLAEDDEDDRMFFETFLVERKDIHLLQSVSDGEALIEALHDRTQLNQLPDIIILDQNMPRMNGLETLKVLKASETYTRIPVVIYSTYIHEKLIESCLECGASLVLEKPDGKDGYLEMLDRMVAVIGKEESLG
jgi:CheY-like chemotaxis protein